MSVRQIDNDTPTPCSSNVITAGLLILRIFALGSDAGQARRHPVWSAGRWAFAPRHRYFGLAKSASYLAHQRVQHNDL